MSRCAHCGQSATLDAVFCAQCGQRLQITDSRNTDRRSGQREPTTSSHARKIAQCESNVLAMQQERARARTRARIMLFYCVVIFLIPPLLGSLYIYENQSRRMDGEVLAIAGFLLWTTSPLSLLYYLYACVKDRKYDSKIQKIQNELDTSKRLHSIASIEDTDQLVKKYIDCQTNIDSLSDEREYSIHVLITGVVHSFIGSGLVLLYIYFFDGKFNVVCIAPAIYLVYRIVYFFEKAKYIKSEAAIASAELEVLAGRLRPSEKAAADNYIDRIREQKREERRQMEREAAREREIRSLRSELRYQCDKRANAENARDRGRADARVREIESQLRELGA